MQDETFDDGLVHRHRWSITTPRLRTAPPRAHRPGDTRTPSTALHDDLHFGD